MEPRFATAPGPTEPAMVLSPWAADRTAPAPAWRSGHVGLGSRVVAAGACLLSPGRSLGGVGWVMVVWGGETVSARPPPSLRVRGLCWRHAPTVARRGEHGEGRGAAVAVGFRPSPSAREGAGFLLTRFPLYRYFLSLVPAVSNRINKHTYINATSYISKCTYYRMRPTTQSHKLIMTIRTCILLQTTSLES